MSISKLSMVQEVYWKRSWTIYKKFFTFYDQRMRIDTFKLVFVPKLNMSVISYVVQGARISEATHGSEQDMK